MLCGVTATQGSNPCATAFRLVAPTDVGATSFLLGRLLRGWVEWAWPGTFGLLRELFDSFGLGLGRSVSATFRCPVKQAWLTREIKREVVPGTL